MLNIDIVLFSDPLSVLYFFAVKNGASALLGFACCLFFMQIMRSYHGLYTKFIAVKFTS
jgi:hypothetical protein